MHDSSMNRPNPLGILRAIAPKIATSLSKFAEIRLNF